MSDSTFYDRLHHFFKPSRHQIQQKKPILRLDDHGLLELASGQDPIVDIIAIHGLDGHRLYTWIAETAQSERVMWLQEFLPSDIPHARILTYGYDADTRSSEFTSTNTIQRHAMGFMQAVERARKGVERVRSRGVFPTASTHIVSAT
ncbi:hypothetical protein PIIN_10687, partial [Serendipita indica DSM 11827]